MMKANVAVCDSTAGEFPAEGTAQKNFFTEIVSNYSAINFTRN
jgi:hypothetical protein